MSELMKIKAITVLVLVLVTGCTWDTSIGVAVGQTLGSGPREFNAKPSCSFMIRHESPTGYYVEYNHRSLCFEGAPFNNDREMWHDDVRIGKKWIIRQGAKK